MPLLPALRYLVMSPAFSNALGQRPALTGETRLHLLHEELEKAFTVAICRRMTTVLRGLLGLPAGEIAALGKASAPPTTPGPQPMPRPPQPLQRPLRSIAGQSSQSP